MALTVESFQPDILSSHVPHITFVTADTPASTLTVQPGSSPQTQKLILTNNGVAANTGGAAREPSEAKFGSLIPVSNINNSNKVGIYIDKGIQVGSPWGIFEQTSNVNDLPPNIRMTYDLVDQYILRTNEAKNAIFKLPSFPTLPDDVWTDILTNRFVDIGRIHTAYTAIPGICTITTFEEWYKTFEMYEEGVCIAFPHRKEEFNTWRNNILKLFGLRSESEHSLIIRTESALRQSIFDRRKQSLDDEKSLTSLHASFNALVEATTAIRKSHEPKEEPAPKKERAPGICRRWNLEEGCKHNACRYKHVCKRCQSEGHTAVLCPTRKPKANPETKTVS